MEDFFAQLEAAVTGKMWYLALSGSLMVPDICGAMATPDGMATAPRYKAWFDTYVGAKYIWEGHTLLSGEDCWGLRCLMLHQGRAVRSASGFDRVLFFPAGLHGSVFQGTFNGMPMNVLTLVIPTFCKDIVDGGRAWLAEMKGTPDFQRNFDRFLQARPTGLPPFVKGYVIA